MYEYQNIKTFFQKVTFQINLKKFFMITKVMLLLKIKYITLVIQSKKLIINFKINIKCKYFTTSDSSKLKNDILDAKIIPKKLVNESGLNEKIKTLATKEEIKTLATKAELKTEKDKIVKLETHDLSYFLGKTFFGDDASSVFFGAKCSGSVVIFRASREHIGNILKENILLKILDGKVVYVLIVFNLTIVTVDLLANSSNHRAIN